LKITFIRHGKTKSNSEHRYLGKTDEDILESEKEFLQNKATNKNYPDADIVFLSPMTRCKTSADLIYPDTEKIVIDEYKECDFGLWEMKTYKEILEDASLKDDYQKFIDTNGESNIPCGESKSVFTDRCIKGFWKMVGIIQKQSYENASCIVHGGTIMAILSSLCIDNKDYYDYSIQNGEGIITSFDGKDIDVLTYIRRD